MIVIGSQDHYSNEIIAEIYAQALEAADFTVDLPFRIGQREVYVAEIEDGTIDLFPECTGPLLTPEGLLELNTRSVDEQVSGATIAADWLADNTEQRGSRGSSLAAGRCADALVDRAAFRVSSREHGLAGSECGGDAAEDVEGVGGNKYRS